MIILLDFLQKYNGAITAIATVVLSITTIVYARLTSILASENRLLRKAGTEPEVVAYLIPDQRYINMINLVIANIGRGAARNVALEYRLLAEDINLRKIAFKFVGRRPLIATLPQDERIVTFFGSAIDLLGDGNPLDDFEIEVRYLDLTGKERINLCSLSVKNLEGLSSIGKPPDVEIADTLGKILNEMKNNRRL